PAGAQHQQAGLLQAESAVHPAQQQVGDLLAAVLQCRLGAGDDGLGVQQGLDRLERVGGEGAAGGHQVADHVCLTQSRSDLDRAGQCDDLRRHTLLGEPAAEGAWITGRDPLTAQLFGTGPLLVVLDGDVEPADAPSQLAPLLESTRLPRALTGQVVLDEHVAPDDPQVADTVGDETGDVVVPDEQQVDGQRLAVAEELVAALPPGQPARGEQVAGRLGEAAGLLDRDAQAVAGGGRRGHADLPGLGRRGPRVWAGASSRRVWAGAFSRWPAAHRGYGQGP